MQAQCPDCTSHQDSFGDPEESSAPQALLATLAEAVSQLAPGRRSGMLPGPEGLHIPSGYPSTLSRPRWGNLMPEVLGFPAPSA